MKRLVLMLLAGSLLVAACGSETPGEASELPTTIPEPGISDPLPTAGDDGATMLAGMGPGISVAEALESTLDEPLLVNGYVFVYSDGTVVIADVIAESFPPQPAGAQIEVEGLDLMQIPLTEGPDDTELEIVAWTDVQVQLIGEVVDGVFVGNSVASA